jgi:hypothetical protein
LTEPRLGEAVLSASRATNLLAPIEKARVQDLLHGSDADAFVHAAAVFTRDGDAAALGRLAAVLGPHGCATWTVATYLPFLWLPERHMFLRPNVTKDYAARVGDPFASIYQAPLTFDVYASLLALVERTERELVAWKPRDRIDIQSFIWVVGKYADKAEEAPVT